MRLKLDSGLFPSRAMKVQVVYMSVGIQVKIDRLQPSSARIAVVPRADCQMTWRKWGCAALPSILEQAVRILLRPTLRAVRV